ncbi:hypothetical protein [Dactylosporangium sp. CS-033363]|uniref:hypothetical protein n=1 Tax=Dactylosporangium sp. CS-033363 TaxID=3239935 RepID=UPI003D92290C
MASKKRVRPSKANGQWNEALHPRNEKGQFTKSFAKKLTAEDIDRTRHTIKGLQPREFPDGHRAAGYLAGLPQAPRTPGVERYLAPDGWRDTHAALRAGEIPDGLDDLDAALRPLPDDLVVTRQVPADAFGRISDLGQLEGLKLHDAAPIAASLHSDAGPAKGMISMRIAVPAGTRAIVDPQGRGVTLDRDLDLAITRAKRNQAGGWDVSAVAIGQREDVSGMRPRELPDDLSTMADDDLVDAIGWLAPQGRDDDIVRVADELDRREAAAARHYTLLQDPEHMSGDELDTAFADASAVGDELAIGALYEEYERRERLEAEALVKASAPPEAPAMVGQSFTAWLDLAGSPIPGHGASTPETRERAQRAIRRTYNLPDDASLADVSAATVADQRSHEERTGWHLAWYRKLAAADGVSPDDRANYGPPDDPDGVALYHDNQQAKAKARAHQAAQAAKAETRAAKVAVGPAGPALVRNPIGELGELQSIADSYARTGAVGRGPHADMVRESHRIGDRLGEARRRMYGLDPGAHHRELEKAIKADRRHPHERAADTLGWYRLLADADGVEPGTREAGPVDVPGEFVRPGVVPSRLPKPDELQAAIREVAVDDQRAGNPATGERFAIASRRTMGLPDDATQAEYSAAYRHDPRSRKQLAAEWLAHFRQVGEEHGVDRSDPFRFGPQERTPKTKGAWAETSPVQQQRMDELVARGWSFADAYAEVHNLDPADIKAARARGAVDRHAGETTDAAVKRQYGEHVDLQYIVAERAIRGHMLSKAGQAAGVDPKSLFSGPANRFHKYASEELQRWFQDQGGRMTYTQFKAQVLGRQRDIEAAKRSKLAGNGRDFG